MKERPILFSAPMVRAIIAGRKTQTRRAVKPVGNDDGFVILNHGMHDWPYRSDDGDSSFHTVKRGGKLYLDETPHTCPYGKPGDRLWVREAWAETDREDGTPVIAYRAGGNIAIGRDHPKGNDYLIDTIAWDDMPHVETWRPSIHMPRWASRILLEITAVRVERLQDISEADAQAEGAPFELGELERLILGAKAKYRSGFCRLWQSINGPGSWDANPWVWVVEFKRV